MAVQLPSSGSDAAVDASSVLLLREHEGRLEVFVVERRKAGAFAGVLAFPGGKVDVGDRSLNDAMFRGLDVAAATTRWGLEADAPNDRARVLGWYVAAVRELFEEVGVLLAVRRSGDGGHEPVPAADLASSSFVEARGRLMARDAPWDWTPWLREHGLVLDLAGLLPWSRWITPEGEPRRFDTMFLLATVPPAQADALAHDEIEVVESRWLAPAAVLAEREDGRSVVIYPTRRQLASLPPVLGDLEAVLADRDLRPVQPVISIDAEGVIVAQHPVDGSIEPVF